MQYEKLLNELYVKYIGLKGYNEIDSLLSDWQKIEEEFLGNTDPGVVSRMEVLYRIKSVRFKECVRKLLKNLKLNEDVIPNVMVLDKFEKSDG
jgi:hypothetical protein